MTDYLTTRNMDRVLAKLDQARWNDAVHGGLEELGTAIVERGRSEASSYAPDRLLSSFAQDIQGTGIASELHVSVHGPGARAVEYGRRPMGPFPNVDDISGWLGRKGGDPQNAFIVARSIGATGTKGRHFFRHAIFRGQTTKQLVVGLAGAIKRAVNA